MPHRTLIVANWKMHGTQTSAGEFASKAGAKVPSGIDAVFCPPYTYLNQPQKGGLSMGAQDCAAEPQGAYTGEVSAAMLKDVGCRYVILGHSERRTHYEETDAMIAAKAACAIQVGITPIFCIGETEKERADGKTNAVLERQLAPILPLGEVIVIAYEPVWAIGTGKTPTAEQIEEAHGFIHAQLQKTARDTRGRVLYGGSVKPTNIREILALKGVDGALVGGASLEVDAFVTMLQAAAEIKGVK